MSSAHTTAAATDRTHSLVELHKQRTLPDLVEQARATFETIVPGARAVVMMGDELTGGHLVLGGSERLTDEERSVANSPGAENSLALRYGAHELGRVVLLGTDHGSAEIAAVEEFTSHFAVAHVNLRLATDATKSSEQYYSSLQALEQGVVLFQEQDREAVSARFLSLITSMFGTAIGAVYLLEEPGDTSSMLCLDNALGLPEMMLDQLVDIDGEWWPQTIVGEGPRALLRDEAGVLPSLHNDSIPPTLQNIATCPLHYHGLTVGLGLVFNSTCEPDSIPSRLESARRLGELGAAFFHRLQLEEVAVRSQEVETQLQIAATIQKRLIPTTAPEIDAATCAWHSEPAQVVGGDYLDLMADAQGRLHAVMADVSGHGINSALLMTSFRATYRAECGRRSPDQLLAKINDEIANETGDTGMFVTAATLRIEADGRSMTYASAGHNDVMIFRAGTGTVERLESTGPSTGFFSGSDYDAVEVALATDDVILLYTDGLVEATGDGGDEDMFTEDRLADLLAEIGGDAPDEILARVRRELAEFSGTTEYDDDVSISVLRIA